jgi:hypothetical protein
LEYFVTDVTEHVFQKYILIEFTKNISFAYIVVRKSRNTEVPKEVKSVDKEQNQKHQKDGTIQDIFVFTGFLVAK